VDKIKDRCAGFFGSKETARRKLSGVRERWWAPRQRVATNAGTQLEFSLSAPGAASPVYSAGENPGSHPYWLIVNIFMFRRQIASSIQIGEA